MCSETDEEYTALVEQCLRRCDQEHNCREFFTGRLQICVECARDLAAVMYQLGVKRATELTKQ